MRSSARWRSSWPDCRPECQYEQARCAMVAGRTHAMTQARGKRFGFRSLALVVMALAAFRPAGAHADTYPNRPVRLIVPFAACGLNDVVARLVAPYLERSLGKANPGKLNYASPGAATQTHLVVELFSRKADIKLQHIPYRGGAPAMTAMVAGDTQFTAISTLLSLPQIQAGALRAIASGSLSRDAQLPDLPTVAEQGFPS